MKKTILILALMLAAITAIGAMTPAPKTSAQNGLNAETGNYIYYVYHHYYGYRTYNYTPRVYDIAPAVPLRRVWFARYW
jgi:hypothetical protein